MNMEDTHTHQLKNGDEALAEGSGDSLDQMVPPVLENGNVSFGDEPSDTRTTEEVVRDDMFVDCPDEIENSESQQSSDEKDISQDDHYNESDSGIKVQHLMAELEKMRDNYDKSVAEKESYEAERIVLVRELADLRSQLNVYSEKQISQGEITDALSDHLEKDQQVNDIVDRILGSLSMAVQQEELSNVSSTEKISNVEKSVTSLVDKYSLFLSQINQLRECLTGVGSDLGVMDDVGVLVIVRNKFVECKVKEDGLYQNLSHLEDQNNNLVEQLEKHRSIIDNANLDIRRLNAEVEQERNRYANTKEKLGMAVTKGKALVQQRDSLKQLVAEKTTVLEKCMIELQDKSSALETAEQRNELLVASENFAASLQESLAEKDRILHKCGEVLSEVVGIEEMQGSDITEKLEWLADESKSLNAVALQYHKLSDALMLFDFPETVASSELDERVRWLAESFSLSREETLKLQSEIAEMKEASNHEIDRLTSFLTEERQARSDLQAELEDIRNKYEAHESLHHELSGMREAANIEIDRLTKSLVAESQDKNYLQEELVDLRDKYEGVVEKEYRTSLEKDQIVNLLLGASGLAKDDMENLSGEHSNMTRTIENCLVKIKEEACQPGSAPINLQIIESLQSHLYVTDLDMRLCKLIAEETTSNRVEVDRLSHDLVIITQELNSVKEEKGGLQRSLEQLEDRCGLLKEKLSMAVKKGKGLVQERENLKGSLNEKNLEIEKLKSELQQSESMCNECQDKITKLSLDIQHISQLEIDLASTKEHADQLEQLFAERNNMLQRVIKSIEDIDALADSDVEEPVEKVKWLAGFVKELQTEKMEVEQELSNVKEQSSSFASKLSETQTSIESLEDALSMAENNLSRLLNEKKEIEVSKAVLEEEFWKQKEEASSHMNKFEEVSVSKRALEDALQLAESNISRFVNERDIAQESQALAEEQLQKLKAEFVNHINKLSDAEKTIQSLEDALSLAENNLSRLVNEKKELEVSKAVLEEEFWKQKEEASSHTNKFEEVSVSKRALEDALQLAENNISRFVNERDIAQESQALAEEQLQELKAEFVNHINKLSDAEKTIQSLEDALSQAEKNVSQLSEEKNKLKLGSSDLDDEMKKMTEEAGLQVSKLSDAFQTIQSLENTLSNAENNMAGIVHEKENAEREVLTLSTKLQTCMEELLNAENNMSVIVQEKKNAEQEILTLRTKLNSCMEELSGTRGSIENRAAELSSQLDRLQLVLKDDTFSSAVDQCFSRKIESLSKMDFLLKEMKECILEVNSDVVKHIFLKEDDTSVPSSIPFDTNITLKADTNVEGRAVDGESSLFHVEKIDELFHLKDRMLADKFDNFSTRLDESIAALSRSLSMTRDGLVSTINYVNSLKEQVNDLESNNQRQADSISSLENDIRILSSACADATHCLDSNLHKSISGLKSVHQLEEFDDRMSNVLAAVVGDAELPLNSDQGKFAETLLLATRHNQDFSELIQDMLSKFVLKMGELENKLQGTELICHEVSEERDLYKDQISKLETDLETTKSLCEEMQLKVEEFQEKQDHVKQRDAELSSLSKIQEPEDSLLSASQVSSILKRISEVEVPDGLFSVGEPSDSADLRKLFYVIDKFSETLQKISSLSHEKEDLLSCIEKQSLEILSLGNKIKDQIENEKESEKMFNDLLELESGFKSIIQKLGGNDLVDDQKASGVIYLLPLLDKLVTAKITESENLQSWNDELVNKLRGSDMIVEDLSNKVKLLEDSNQARSVPVEIEQERGTSVSSLSNQSEISEVQDMGALGKSSNVPAVPSAAHVRTMRKGSSDHLSINIDSDSERLIKNKEPDEDKGHVFKSLNTSGLIPRQGRIFADRVDGIWVYGSRALMSHPRGRLGLVAYWLVLHMWLLGTIL